MATAVNASNITDADVTNAGKYFVYALLIALGAIIGTLIIIALAVYIIREFPGTRYSLYPK